MLTLSFILKNIRSLFIVALVCYFAWLYQENKINKLEAKRQTENAENLRKVDSVKYAYQLLSKSEVNDYLNYQNKDLKEKLAKAGIKVKNVKEIISTSYKFKDTLIKKYIPGPFIDSSKCLTIKGYTDSSGVTFTEKKFVENLNVVSHYTTKQWKFLFIKSRLFGKKEVTTTVFNDCGESKTFKVEVKK